MTSTSGITDENRPELTAILAPLPGLDLPADADRREVRTQIEKWASEPGHAEDARTAFTAISANLDHARAVGLEVLEVLARGAA